MGIIAQAASMSEFPCAGSLGRGLSVVGRRNIAVSELDFQPNSDRCLVFADPADHPFCLTTLGEIG
jgi:hypothetical protein